MSAEIYHDDGVMGEAVAVAVAVTFVWLGMVVAISFVEAPLKFRAPNVTLHIGLGIGRLVFRALNLFEIAFALVLVVTLLTSNIDSGAEIALMVVIAALVVQLVFIRPRLTRRTNEVLSGQEGPRSHAHVGYVALELVKVVGLLVAGVLLLQT